MFDWRVKVVTLVLGGGVELVVVEVKMEATGRAVEVMVVVMRWLKRLAQLHANISERISRGVSVDHQGSSSK